jgi:ketosteroid isomerase-like protein
VSALPVLSIEPSPGALRYRLDLSERDLGEPLQEEFRHPVDEATMTALQQSADDLLRSGESPRFTDEARARGAVLYRTLVPPRLRAKLAAIRGPLLVSTSLYGMPWELLHDDEEFWGLRYALGKRLVMDRPLPFVGREVEAICETLEPFADVDCVTGPLATFDAVTAQLSAGFDLIHYCGHVVTGAGGRPALLLAEERLLPAAAIEANLRGRPLVFLNGCASARGETHHPAGSWEATASGVAYGFLFGGAVAVVGTLSDVGDRHAAALAEEFYRRALVKVPVGEALRAARAHCRADPESAGSPTWLSFVLYGNPAQALLPGDVERTAAAAPAARRVPRRAVGLAALLLLAVVLVAGLLRYRQPSPAAPLVVGVMEVRVRSDAVPRWMADVTRDRLNTILSKFGELRVYSRQKIDFIRGKRHLSEIEAAEVLGMSKMLAATVSADGSQVTLDLEVVDIGTGLLQGTERVQGPQDRFMELEGQLAVRAVQALGVRPTAAEMQAVAATSDNETLDVYRMLTDTLGDPAAVPKEQSPPPTAPAKPAPGTSWLEWDGAAYAEDADPEEAAVRALVERYAAALQAKSLEQLGALQVQMSERQRAALLRYFATAGDLQVRLSDLDVTVEGGDAVATFTREDAFVDAGTGRHLHLEVRITAVLGKEQGEWKIRGLQ